MTSIRPFRRCHLLQMKNQEPRDLHNIKANIPKEMTIAFPILIYRITHRFLAHRGSAQALGMCHPLALQVGCIDPPRGTCPGQCWL